jgi:hypothetical protein
MRIVDIKAESTTIYSPKETAHSSADPWLTPPEAGPCMQESTDDSRVALIGRDPPGGTGNAMTKKECMMSATGELRSFGQHH